jgi:thiol-disulfide isomerase/thioredoxin
MKKFWIVFALGLFALVLGSYAGLQKFQPATETSAATLDQIELPDVDKKLRNGEEWLGKVVVVNHWATWCPPCREEIPLLIETQQRLGGQGLQIVGIAHDMLDATREYGDNLGINYPSLVAIVGGGELMQQQGNVPGGALPFTVFFDREGNLAGSKLGRLSEQDLIQAITPLL